MKEYYDMIKRTFDYSGRSSLRDFWVAEFTSLFVGLAFSLFALPFASDSVLFVKAIYALYMLYSIIMFFPSLSLIVRRLKDGGYSPWLIFLALLPIFGETILIILLCSRSKFHVDVWYKDYNENNYGAEQGTQDTTDSESIFAESNQISSVDESQKTNVQQAESDSNKFESENDEPIKFDESKVTISDTAKTRSQKIVELQKMRDNGEITAEEYQKRIMEILSN